jgi:hypothetical protein
MMSETDQINNVSIFLLLLLLLLLLLPTALPTHKQVTFSGKVSIFHQPIACHCYVSHAFVLRIHESHPSFDEKEKKKK